MLVDAEHDQDEFRGDARKITPTTTLAIEDNNMMNPPNGLIAIAASAGEDPGNAEQHDQRR